MCGKIIENHRAFSEDTYKVFKKDYMTNEIGSWDLIEKYGFSRTEYNTYCGVVYERTGFKRPPARKKPQNFYYDKTNKRYVVYKRINGKVTYYGYYKHKGNAKKIVERLREIDWDKNQLKKIQEDLFGVGGYEQRC